jgi:hypothetical protein
VRNAVEALFRLEHGHGREDLLRVFDAFRVLLRDPEQAELRRTFSLWIGRQMESGSNPRNAAQQAPQSGQADSSTLMVSRHVPHFLRSLKEPTSYWGTVKIRARRLPKPRDSC